MFYLQLALTLTHSDPDESAYTSGDSLVVTFTLNGLGSELLASAVGREHRADQAHSNSSSTALSTSRAEMNDVAW